jgi:hypothetical protein
MEASGQLPTLAALFCVYNILVEGSKWAPANLCKFGGTEMLSRAVNRSTICRSCSSQPSHYTDRAVDTLVVSDS